MILIPLSDNASIIRFRLCGNNQTKVEKKLKAQGKKRRDLFSAIGKELGKMYRAQKKTSPKPVNKSRKPKKTSRKYRVAYTAIAKTEKSKGNK